jgi:hypothetical protein
MLSVVCRDQGNRASPQALAVANFSYHSMRVSPYLPRQEFLKTLDSTSWTK